MSGTLVLRDVHVPPAPPLWPPAPGWWLVAVAAVLLALAIWWIARRRRARRRALAEVFDMGVAAASTPTARVAACSELLRRAARTRRPDADRLQGEAWLAFLDGKRDAFSCGPGRLLLDGPFRPEVDPGEADALVAVARRRFIDLMAGR